VSEAVHSPSLRSGQTRWRTRRASLVFSWPVLTN
jgi:hypothetical protein